MRRLFWAVTVPLCILFSLAPAFGQSSSISGTVADPSGALIPGVTVTAVSSGTGVDTKVVSNESGAYNFASLPPGTYKVSAALPGFQTAAFDNIVLGNAAQLRFNFTLKVGSVSTQVEVSVDAQSLLTTSSASIGEVLNEQRVRDLPMVRGDILDLVRIMPGMRVDPFGDQFSAFTGLPTNTINTTRDGLSVTDTRNNILSGTTTVNPDLVGEIRIILSPVDAELGRGNGQIQIQTRSGTNKYTGSAVWNVRNTALAANSWANNRNVDPFTKEWSPTPLNWRNTHQYTVSYGGPIIRNKTFFFALWDQNISRTRTLVTNNVLTDTARQGIFRYFDNCNGGDAPAAVSAFPASATAGVYPVVDFSGDPVAPPLNPNGTAYTGACAVTACLETSRLMAVPLRRRIALAASLRSALRHGIPCARPWIHRLYREDTDGDAACQLLFLGATTVDGLNLAQFHWLRGAQGISGASGQGGTVRSRSTANKSTSRSITTSTPAPGRRRMDHIKGTITPTTSRTGPRVLTANLCADRRC